MSKSFPGAVPPALDPDEQMLYLVRRYGDHVHPSTLARVKQKAHELALHFQEAELLVLAALDTPDRVQQFLNGELHYNNDHASADQDETAMPPRQVLRTGMAHCFEGAMFAYAVNFLHGFAPQLCLLESIQDSEHNLVIVRDHEGGWYGCNAHSRYPHLDGRPMQYETLRQLADSYAPWYYSDRTRDPRDVTVVGYSEPFDLVKKYGAGWMASDEPLWKIYYTYIDDTVRFHYLRDDPGRPHLYPLIQALQQRWIEVDAAGAPVVSAGHLPPPAQEIWRQFFAVHDPEQLPVRGAALELQKRFWQLTGTTPIDLQDNADDLQYFLAAGYRVSDLLTARSESSS
jgi:hypothetical protein